MLVNYIQHVYASYIQIHMKVRRPGLHQVHVVHDPIHPHFLHTAIGILNKVGTIEHGKEADMIVLAADPINNIRKNFLNYVNADFLL